MGRVELAVLVLLSMVALSHPQASPSPSWKCRVCEDVVQTWHDRFKCQGSSLSSSESMPNPYSPEGQSKSIQACRQPTLDCNDLNDHLKPICKAMRYQFVTRKQPLIWSTIMDRGNIYDTCVQLGKCINDTEQADAHDCRLSFKNESCHDHLACAPVEKHCSSRCFLCYHLVRDWPLFQQTCKPAGSRVPEEAHPTEEKLQLKNGDKPAPTGAPKKGKGSFLELHGSAGLAGLRGLQQKRQWSLADQRRAKQRAKELRMRADSEADRLAGPFGRPRNRAPDVDADHRQDYFDDVLLQVESSVNPYDLKDDEQAEQEDGALRKYELSRRAVQEAEDARSLIESNAHQAAYESAAEEKEEEKKGAVIPVPNGDTLPLECHEQWDDIRYSKKARYFVQWLQEVAITPTARDRTTKGGLWDANIVCKCLGKCELSKFEALGLIEVCKYDSVAQQTMDMVLAEYIREKPHEGVGSEAEEEDE